MSAAPTAGRGRAPDRCSPRRGSPATEQGRELPGALASMVGSDALPHCDSGDRIAGNRPYPLPEPRWGVRGRVEMP